MTEFENKVYSAAKVVPKGKVTTYGDIALKLGCKGLSRAVGNALHKNPFMGEVPCHRVVNSKGMLACHFGFGGPLGQKKLLEDEGVEVINLQVDLKKYGFKFK